ncbi:MAG: hypothetical protein ABF321_01390 [Bacteroidia bacterium]
MAQVYGGTPTNISHTASNAAPWSVIPADNKLIMRTMVAGIVEEKLQSSELKYPDVSIEDMVKTKERQNILQNE